MRVRTPRRAWLVPPTRALWIPARTVHELRMHGEVEMRSLYITEPAAVGMPQTCRVLDVTPLARELVVRASTLSHDYDESSDDGLLMKVLLAEIGRLPQCTFDLPLPESADLSRLCEQILKDLEKARPRHVAGDQPNVSGRTLYRRFLAETGISFAQWKRQATLLESIRRLADGTPVTSVALDMGYESASAFSTMFRRAVGAPPRAFMAR
jgi:AraC-like DNA-binding protein